GGGARSPPARRGSRRARASASAAAAARAARPPAGRGTRTRPRSFVLLAEQRGPAHEGAAEPIPARRGRGAVEVDRQAALLDGEPEREPALDVRLRDAGGEDLGRSRDLGDLLGGAVQALGDEDQVV